MKPSPPAARRGEHPVDFLRAIRVAVRMPSQNRVAGTSCGRAQCMAEHAELAELHKMRQTLLRLVALPADHDRFSL